MKQAMRKGVALTFSTLLTLTTWASKSDDVRAKLAEKLGDKSEFVAKLKKRDKRTDIKLAQVLNYLPKQMRVGGQVVEFNLTENKGKDKNGNNDEDDNTPESGKDKNNDAPQYDNFPDDTSVAITEQKNNHEDEPADNPEGGGDGNGDKISNNTNPSTPPKNPEVAPPDPKSQMLAFLKNYPETGSDNYKSFIKELNETLDRVSTSVFITQESTILSRFNSIYFYLTVTDAERDKLKAIAKQLNKIYRWHLKMLDEQSHKELLANPTYASNYKILKKKFTPDVRSACAMVDELDDMGKKTYLLTTYHQFIDAPTSIVSIRDRKSFLVVYHDDVKYNYMPAGEINSHFKSAMNEARKLMLNNLKIIVIPTDIQAKAVKLQEKRAKEAEKQNQKSNQGLSLDYH